MNSILKCIPIASRIGTCTLRSIPSNFKVISTQPVHISSRVMAQRSITSFFKITPPKTPKKEVIDKDVNKEKDDSPPAINGKGKVSSKRQRLESSESESASPKKSPAVSTGKKKPVKRQRIESSGSESETALKASPEPSPTPDQKTDSTIVKTEVTSPKTYASPKSKTKKALVEQNGVKSPKTVKKDKIDKGKKATPKRKIKEEKETVDDISKDNKQASKDKEKVKEEKVESKTDTEEKDEKANIVPETEYNPSKSKYHPINDACWTSGAEVPYLALAKTFELIEATSARLKIIEILSNYLRSVIVLSPEDLLPSLYLCLNQLAPAYQSLELGVAETYLMKAVGQCTGRSLAHMRAGLARLGDLGSVAQLARSEQTTMFTPRPLTVRRLFAALKEIAHMTGAASVSKKINKIQSLYVACRHVEARFLIRSLEGKLRIGLAEQSVLQALALAATLTPPGIEGEPVLDASRGLSPDDFKARVEANALIIKTTHCECPDLAALVAALRAHGVTSLPRHCRLTPGLPLKPMLAHPTKGLSHIFDRFEDEAFTCEWKYDGERAQLHVPGDTEPHLCRAKVFSRSQEDNTSKYPDVLRRVAALLRPTVTSCVLDCEAVAYDTQTKQILPFQVLSTRKRKDASAEDIKVQVCVFVFDLLYLNGAPLVRRPLHERRLLMREHFNEVEGQWQFATSRDCTTVEEVQGFLEEALRGNCEGLMVKALRGERALYDIARRSHNWLKLKKDYIDGIGDTIDAVVIGAYLGKGKRAGTYGGFLLACGDPLGELYQSLCKIGTGFSDEDLASLTASLQEHVIDAPRTYYMFDASHAPDVWLGAHVVWEVRCADLSLSPAHRAARGLLHPDKGISLRFPRFVRARPDKSPSQATSAQQLVDMYLAQDQVKNCKHTFVDEFY